MEKRPAGSSGSEPALKKKSHHATDVVVPVITNKEQLTSCSWSQLEALCVLHGVAKRGLKPEKLQRLEIAIDRQQASEAREMQIMNSHDDRLNPNVEPDWPRVQLPPFAQQIFSWMRKTPGPSLNQAEAVESTPREGKNAAAEALVLEQLHSIDEHGEHILSFEFRGDCRDLRAAMVLLRLKGFQPAVVIFLFGWLHLLYWGQAISYMLGLMLSSPIIYWLPAHPATVLGS